MKIIIRFPNKKLSAKERDDHIKDVTGKQKQVCITGATKGEFCQCGEFIEKQKEVKMENKLYPCMDFDGASYMKTNKELIIRIPVANHKIISRTIPLKKLKEFLK